jgi:hypothetical protein
VGKGVSVEAGVAVETGVGAAQAVIRRAITNIRYFMRESPIVDITCAP